MLVIFHSLAEDELYRFTGVMKSHPKYGIQFQIETFEKEVPATEQGIVHYLSSDLFTGIGRKTAETIVDKLGVNALKLILEDPKHLMQFHACQLRKNYRFAKRLKKILG